MSTARVDKWLWSVRLCRTRSAAADSCRMQRVKIAGQPVKPAREIGAGDVIEVRQDHLVRTVRVLDIPPNRVGARLVPQFLEDLTPPEEFERAAAVRREHSLNRLASPPVKPGKRDRRVLERFLDEVRRAGSPPPPDP